MTIKEKLADMKAEIERNRQRVTEWKKLEQIKRGATKGTHGFHAGRDVVGAGFENQPAQSPPLKAVAKWSLRNSRD